MNNFRSRVIKVAYNQPSGAPLRTALLKLLGQSSKSASFKFWSLVSKIRWTKRVRSSNKAVRLWVMARITPQEAKLARTMFFKLQQKLEQQIADSGVEINLSDDSFHDLTAHIIGSGVRFYNKVMKDPEIAADMALRKDFRESFQYVLPQPSDYTSLDVARYRKMAAQSIKELEAALRDPQFKSLKPLIREMIQVYELVLGKWWLFLQIGRDRLFRMGTDLFKAAYAIRKPVGKESYGALYGSGSGLSNHSAFSIYLLMMGYFQ